MNNRNAKLKIKLLKLGKSQNDLAELLCVSYGMVNHYLNGRGSFNVDQKSKIAKSLNCKIKDVF